MAETNSTMEEKEKYKSLYFRLAINTYSGREKYARPDYVYEWHGFTFGTIKRWKVAKLPAAIQNMPQNIPESVVAVSLDSKIYLVGGLDHNQRSMSSFCFDPILPGDGWRKIPPMLIGREKPSAVGFKGKLYVFGESSRHDYVYPQAEAFDPLSNEWAPLREPPCLLRTLGRPPSLDTDGELGKLVLVAKSSYAGNYKDIVTYDANTESWAEIQVQFSHESGRHTDELGLSESAAVADGIVYWYSKGRNNVYGYDLGNGNWFPNPVVGFEKGNAFPLTNEFPVWLLHLGGGKLCLAWYAVSTAPWRTKNMTVYCTTYRVDKRGDEEAGEVNLVANIESSAYCHVNGSHCVDFIAL